MFVQTLTMHGLEPSPYRLVGAVSSGAFLDFGVTSRNNNECTSDTDS